MKDKWPNIEVHSYKHETIPAGPSHCKLAGLTHEEAVKYDEGETNIMQRVTQGEFKAKKHRVEYIKGNLKENKIESDEKDADTNKINITEAIVEDFSKLKM